jgi:iron complex transport system ATP-binding protein
MVEMGRTPHKGVLQRDGHADAALVEAALRRVGTWDLRDRRYGTLSGGEKQRTLIARALAQEGRVLLLDEPTNHLDVRYQLELLSLVRDLGTTCLLALHDLNLAAAWCDLVAVVDRGCIEAAGTPDAVLTPERIARVFRVHATPYRHPVSGRHQLALAPDSDAIESERPAAGVGREGGR